MVMPIYVMPVVLGEVIQYYWYITTARDAGQCVLIDR